MPKSFLFTNKRYDLYKLNIPRAYCKNEGSDGNGKDDESQASVHHHHHHHLLHVKVPVVTHRLRAYHNNLRKATSFGQQERQLLESTEEKEWTLVIDEDQDQDESQEIQEQEEEEQPVNLSIKKIDLFNLTQLAEVGDNFLKYY
jgi:hypothetical protein